MVRKVLSVSLQKEDVERLSSFSALHRSSVSRIVREALEEYYQRYETLEQAQERLKAAEARIENLKARKASGELITKDDASERIRNQGSWAQSVIQALPQSLSLEDNSAVVALIAEVTQALGSSAAAVVRGLYE